MVTLLLPFVLLLWALFRRGFGWRQAFLLASASWALLLVIITELLSLYNGLTIGWLRLAWLGVAAGIAVACFVYLKPVARRKRPDRLPVGPSFALLVPIVLILLNP